MLRSLLLLMLSIGCTAELSPTQLTTTKVAPRKLTILATGDVGSDTDVCGCKAQQMGGIARRAKMMKDRAGERTIVVDAGDLFFRNWSLPPRHHAHARATAEFVADAAKLSKLDAIAVGERDLVLGVGELKKIGERSGAKLLSANLVHAGSNSSAFDAYAMIERNGMKIGIVAASPELGPNVQSNLVYERNHLATRPLQESIHSAVKLAREMGAEVVIGLLHLGQERATDLLNKLPPGTIDIAIVSHDRIAGKLTLLPGGRSAWINAGSRGKWLVEIDLEVAKGAIGLLEVGALDQQKGGKHLVSGELIALDVSLPEDPEMLELYRKFQDRLIEVNSGAPVPNRADIEYTGSAACKECHVPMWKQWEKTKHSTAWQIMVRTRQTGNLDCIPCHVVGFDRRGGPSSLFGLEKFYNVGCESCHGAGSAHVKNPKVQMDYGKIVPENVCAECHRAAEDQKPFDYEERLPKVRHSRL